jgi:hypothetical protein
MLFTNAFGSSRLFKFAAKLALNSQLRANAEQCPEKFNSSHFYRILSGSPA